MRTKKALSLLLSLLLVLGLLSGAAGALAEDAAQTGVTYYINGLEDLLKLADNCAVDTYSKDVTVILQTDIDLTGSEFSSIPTFGGVFEGGGHTISGLNLTANRSHTGFFRYIQPGAEVKELNLAGSVAPGGSAEYAGGLAGNNAGTIRDCSFNGTVEALTSTGGLVGANEKTGVIENCRVSGTVTGQHYTGGIAGQNLGSIVRCVNSAAVNTTSQEINTDLSGLSITNLDSTTELINDYTDTGGYARADTTNPAAGSLVTVTLTPDAGYEVGSIEIADADGASVHYDYDPAAGAVTFTMPVLSGDPVNDPVNARAKNTVVRVAFAPTATYFEDTQSPVSIATSAGGTVTATPGSSGIYVLDISANEGYELASLSVTDESGAAIPYERINDLGTQYAFTLPASGRACVSASFQRVSDWDIVTGAADTIGSAGSALSSAMDNAQADAGALMAKLNELLRNPNPSPDEAQALLDALGRLSSDLTSAGGAAADIIGAGNTIAGAMGPYIAEAAVNLNEHLGYAMQSLQAASNSITDAVAGVRDVLSYLNGLPDVQFQGLGSEYSQRVDSLCGNMKNISDALTALNTELGSSATVLVEDLRKVNDQFSVVMLMLVDAIKAAASPNIGDVFTDVSEQEGSATEGNVAGCGNSGSVYGDVNVGGIAGAMAIEFDFDPESDLTGSTTISRAFNSRCILRGSENTGTIRAKENCAGGVVGLMELGVTQGCQNYGAVSSESGDYVGGIAGSSSSTIRACWAMCPLTGDDWIGGIAGLGMKLYDCRSLVEIDGGDECLGGVAGALSEDGEATGNLFVSETLHGIDGISYTGGAERVPFASLKALEDVPSEFLDLKLVFVADGVTIKTIHFEYGDSIPENEVPAVPAKEGYTGAWPELDLTNVTFSRTLEAVYTPLDSSVASTAVRGDGVQSLVLVEGSFRPGAAVEADVISSGEAPEDAPALSRGTKSLEELSVSVTGSADESSGYRVRYLAPETDRVTSTIALYVREGGGAWQETDYDTLGNYLCFDVDSSDFELLAVERPADMTRVIIIGAAAVLLVLIITVGSIVRHKRAVRPAGKHGK